MVTSRNIGLAVRGLRLQRGWSQQELANQLGLSQSRLSEIERGQGSFTAEQFLLILRIFNVAANHFVAVDSSSGSELQNVLARLGAVHLRESADVLPTDRLRSPAAAIREALVGAESPRYITALAPVVVANLPELNLRLLQREFLELGLGRRFGWFLDNLTDALHRAERAPIDKGTRSRYRRATLDIDAVLEALRSWAGTTDAPTDILDRDIRTKKTRDEVQAEASEISRRWGIVTRLHPDDFMEALRAVRAHH